MQSDETLLAIDLGTTSTRALLFNGEGRVVGMRQRELTQHYPRAGWVEHDPAELAGHTVAVCREVLTAHAEDAGALRAVGLTNQRETVLIWDRKTGRPIHRAIVWQDRRTADRCRELREAGHESWVSRRTGLVLDPYFSASKIAWILDHVDGAREAAERGELAFGTPDTYLLWVLTDGAVHATDATNASRTLLFDLEAQRWDEELLELFRVPAALLPEVRDSAGDFGTVAEGVLGPRPPLTGVAGDQQAALVGQACFEPGMVKATYGTGCFVVLHTGEQAVRSRHHMLTTVAYRLDGRPRFALEGSIFTAGSAVKWLRDGLGLIERADQTASLAAGIESTGGVYLVPAFTGLGAPHWDAGARGALIGMTLGTGVAEVVRATLESVGYQTRDLVEAMAEDLGTPIARLRIDGGMAVNDWLAQFLADVLDRTVDRPRITETTALGAAMLAARGAGLVHGLDELSDLWALERRFEPSMAPEDRAEKLEGWSLALRRVLTRSA